MKARSRILQSGMASGWGLTPATLRKRGVVGASSRPLTAQQGQLSVASYYPHPARYPENKAVDFGQTGRRTDRSPVIVCGDLNCISPEDNIDRLQMIEAFRSFSTNKRCGGSIFESGKKIFRTLGELKFKDVFPQPVAAIDPHRSHRSG